MSEILTLNSIPVSFSSVNKAILHYLCLLGRFSDMPPNKWIILDFCAFVLVITLVTLVRFSSNCKHRIWTKLMGGRFWGQESRVGTTFPQNRFLWKMSLVDVFLGEVRSRQNVFLNHFARFLFPIFPVFPIFPIFCYSTFFFKFFYRISLL